MTDKPKSRPKQYRVHFSEITFSSVELEGLDPKSALQLAIAHTGEKRNEHFRTTPAAFRVEVQRILQDGKPIWEEVSAECW